MKTPREFSNYLGNLKSNELTNKKQTKENIYFSRGFITCNSREMSTLLREREDLGPTLPSRKFKLLDGSRYFPKEKLELDYFVAILPIFLSTANLVNVVHVESFIYASSPCSRCCK